MSEERDGDRLSRSEKLELALRVWASFALVRSRVHREPLPRFVARLTRSRRPRRRYSARRLSRAVDRSLRVGGHRPPCLVNSLVLFRLLRAQGDPAHLVVGLPAKAADKNAHAWVELDGRDVGPPPGRAGHKQLARYP